VQKRIGRDAENLNSGLRAQDRGVLLLESLLFNLVFENKRVRTTFGGGTVYGVSGSALHGYPIYPRTTRRMAVAPQTGFGSTDNQLSAKLRRFPHRRK